MARLRRIYMPGLSLHVMQRGNNRGRVFSDDQDRRRFLWYLRGAAEHCGTDVHGFVLMDTHYHLLVTPHNAKALPRTIQQLGSAYVQYYNRKYERIGTLWSGRYRAVLIKDERQLLTCLRYIDQNPVAAGIVAAPESYRWSSYRSHAYGLAERWLVDHPIYTQLGPTAKIRQEVYRGLCAPL